MLSDFAKGCIINVCPGPEYVSECNSSKSHLKSCSRSYTEKWKVLQLKYRRYYGIKVAIKQMFLEPFSVNIFKCF